jgi:hypothetical protein
VTPPCRSQGKYGFVAKTSSKKCRVWLTEPKDIFFEFYPAILELQTSELVEKEKGAELRAWLERADKEYDQKQEEKKKASEGGSAT